MRAAICWNVCPRPPPLLTVFGLYWVLLSLKINWSIWLYVALVPILIAVCAGIIKLAEEFGDRQL